MQDELRLRTEVIHPVLSTSLPKAKITAKRIQQWANIKNSLYNGQAGLQFSINSTNDMQRNEMFNNKSLRLASIAEIAGNLPMPIGRKYCLNFAYASNFEVNPNILDDLFDKDKFMVKITPIHNNRACQQNKFKTVNGYASFEPYEDVERSLKEHGWDVLVFIPSMDEEHNLITCGNAILGGSKFKSNKEKVNDNKE